MPRNKSFDPVIRHNGSFVKNQREARPLMLNEDALRSTTQPYHVWYDEQLKGGSIPDWAPPTL
ncbi:MAG: hypothetical protein QNL33_04095 [Akkermansiaceae bacterium]